MQKRRTDCYSYCQTILINGSTKWLNQSKKNCHFSNIDYLLSRGVGKHLNIEEKMHDYLKKTFGFTDFKAGQKEVIQNLLTDHSTVAILPTGTGKSLCYQFYGKYTQQTVLIISPLLSLMQDQVE